MANTTKSRSQTGSYKARWLLSQSSLYLILGIGAVIAIIPFVFMIQTSFKTYGEHGARSSQRITRSNDGTFQVFAAR